ncbi:conserved hypothetical protein [Leadbettera azotonutricia ZAS-9]|uniref:Uncharacterized protein n=1 Tax=Leadbettera azotonutricia (strain ATCC BAA-888 / DSM 13862 / ZAS-9) TaxID=545695 RepID=F5Y9W5_LEAAZ|nr:conserved hypothetical protein [Leadbettera azotonutricia ZAS-9]
MRINYLYFVLPALLCISCSAPSARVLAVSDGMEFIINPGEEWKKPQFAAWLTDIDGSYVSTILVSNRSGNKSWRMAPKAGRPEALPVWEHSRSKSMYTDEIDSVTSATPKGVVQTAFDNHILVIGGEYHIFLEVNQSFDYNDRWPKKAGNNLPAAGVNGQPSLVYSAGFIYGEPFDRVQLSLAGHGAVDGSHGDIIVDTEGMTTALSIIKDAFLANK